jgi:hypothetical protein|tara:strand:- start:77 stop:250 length:174 start_codon:yes stop_codon:yes gene_type:complete
MWIVKRSERLTPVANSSAQAASGRKAASRTRIRRQNKKFHFDRVNPPMVDLEAETPS